MKNKEINPKVILGVIAILSVFLALRNNNTSNIEQTNTESFTESIDTSSFVSFSNWCFNKDELRRSTRNTIDELLNEIDTFDCDLAEKRLSTIKFIGLYGKGDRAFDLRPLQSLPHLMGITADYAKIQDLRPLQGLVNLKQLKLGGNQISDITPLQNLTKLEELSLGQNQISDITPIASLVNLEKLVLSGNNISDITPLQNMEKLDRVYLNDNQIEDETCPVKPEYTCIFFLRN